MDTTANPDGDYGKTGSKMDGSKKKTQRNKQQTVTPKPHDNAPFSHVSDDEDVQSAARILSAAQTDTPTTTTDAPSKERPFRCLFCSKTYIIEAALRRHEKKSVCARNNRELNRDNREPKQPIPRLPSPLSNAKRSWTCPRCAVPFHNKFSVERHIKEACWKICDSCAVDEYLNCDGYKREGPCSRCSREQHRCKKHTAPRPGSVPVKLAVKNSQDVPSGTHISKKRDASQSPDAAPKPLAKNPRGFLAINHIQGPSRASENTASSVQRPLSSRMPGSRVVATAAVPALHRNTLKETAADTTPKQPPVAEAKMAEKSQNPLRSRSGPRPATSWLAVSPQRAQSSQDANTPTVNPPQTGWTAVNVPRSRAPLTSMTGAQYQVRAPIPATIPATAAAPSISAPSNPTPQYPNVHSGEYRQLPNMSRVQSQDNQWTQSTGQMNAQQQRFSQSYGNGSHVAYANPYASTGYQYGRLSAVRTPMLDSPRSPIEDGSALPYGNTGQASGGFHVYEDLSLYDLENRTPVHSRPGSRQDIYAATRPNTPGYQSANHGVSYLRPPQGYAPAYPSLPLENSTYDNTFHQADWYARSQQWAGRVVPTHYIQPRPAPEPYDPDITLRVISINVTNQAYFNLHLRHSFVFGPYFEAYCRQHGKRFQVDWEFIYRAEHNGQRVQAIIGWDTTPNLDEYPGIMMRNGDTIEIREINVAANEDLDVATDQGDAEPSEASSQSSDQEDHEEPEAEDDEEEPENGTDNVAELRELNRNLTVENDTLRADNIRLRSEIVMLRRGPVHPIGREAPTPVAAASSAISGAGSGSRSGRHKAAIASLRPPSPRPTSAEEAASDIRPAQKEVAQEPPHQSTSAGHARPNLDDTDDDADELAEELIFAGNGPLDSAPHMNESQIANPAMLNISPSRGLLDPLASELRHERTTSAWSNSSLSSISGSDDDEELR